MHKRTKATGRNLCRFLNVISKGYEDTSISDIMDMAGGAKGMFYRCFQSKDEVMHALGNQMFFENNPFEAVKGRDDLNGLQKIRLLLTLNQSDAERNQINMQAVPILKDPHILAAAVGENRRVLTPLWLELLEEGKQDGSIKTAICFSCCKRCLFFYYCPV